MAALLEIVIQSNYSPGTGTVTKTYQPHVTQKQKLHIKVKNAHTARHVVELKNWTHAGKPCNPPLARLTPFDVDPNGKEKSKSHLATGSPDTYAYEVWVDEKNKEDPEIVIDPIVGQLKGRSTKKRANAAAKNAPVRPTRKKPGGRKQTAKRGSKRR
jgi:hypothetical protein